MANWITKRNIRILTFVLLGLFVAALVRAALPLIKSESVSSVFRDERESTPTAPPSPREQQGTYACPNHAAVTSNSPGKCSECGTELKEVDRFAAIVDRELFDAHLIVKVAPPLPPPQPLNLELLGVTYTDRLVAVIEDKARGASEYVVGVGDEVPNNFGVTVTSITVNPPLVKLDRPGVGEEELKIPEQQAAGAPDQGWSEIIKPVRAGYTYVVKVPELQRRIPSIESYRGSIGLEPVAEGTRVVGLRITSLPSNDFLSAAGFKIGDVINTIQGTAITDEASALSQLQSAAQGFSIQVGVTTARTSRTMVYTLVKK